MLEAAAAADGAAHHVDPYPDVADACLACAAADPRDADADAAAVAAVVHYHALAFETHAAAGHAPSAACAVHDGCASEAQPADPAAEGMAAEMCFVGLHPDLVLTGQGS